jgi:hypothetical protein
MAVALARATAVTGAMLEAIAEKRRLSRRPFAYLTLVGRVFWEFVEVASPRTLSEIIFVYWLQVLLMSAVVVSIAGAVLSNAQARDFGLFGIVVLLILYFIRRAVRRLFEGRSLLTATSLSVGTIAAVLATAALLATVNRWSSSGSTWVMQFIS